MHNNLYSFTFNIVNVKTSRKSFWFVAEWRLTWNEKREKEVLSISSRTASDRSNGEETPWTDQHRRLCHEGKHLRDHTKIIYIILAGVQPSQGRSRHRLLASSLLVLNIFKFTPTALQTIHKYFFPYIFFVLFTSVYHLGW